MLATSEDATACKELELTVQPPFAWPMNTALQQYPPFDFLMDRSQSIDKLTLKNVYFHTFLVGLNWPKTVVIDNAANLQTIDVCGQCTSLPTQLCLRNCPKLRTVPAQVADTCHTLTIENCEQLYTVFRGVQVLFYSLCCANFPQLTVMDELVSRPFVCAPNCRRLSVINEPERRLLTEWFAPHATHVYVAGGLIILGRSTVCASLYAIAGVWALCPELTELELCCPEFSVLRLANDVTAPKLSRLHWVMHAKTITADEIIHFIDTMFLTFPKLTGLRISVLITETLGTAATFYDDHPPDIQHFLCDSDNSARIYWDTSFVNLCTLTQHIECASTLEAVKILSSCAE